jgi:hypothetical protein
MHPPLPFLS